MISTILLSVLISSPIHLDEPRFVYYGSSFHQTYFNEEASKIEFEPEDAVKFKKDLLRALTSTHLSAENAYDLMMKECPEELAEGMSCFKRKRLSYKEARRNLFGKFHLGGNEVDGYFVKDVYCEKEFRAEDFAEGDAIPGPMLIPFHEIVNTEHSWPKSRFNKAKSRNEQMTDLHHLFPTDSEHNRMRGNYLFAEVSGENSKLRCEQNKLGTHAEVDGIDSSNQKFYEPPLAHRGNLARALFYFSTLYDAPIAPIEEHFLRKWHKEDPVDELEKARNEAIFEVQRNRNPFIDYPELTELLSDF
jgi:endonuclease I